MGVIHDQIASYLSALDKIRGGPEGQLCSRFVRLVLSYLRLLCQSASVERSFSHHRGLKTACRNRLEDATMDSLTHVELAVSSDEDTSFHF
jgi:hypothetical protein